MPRRDTHATAGAIAGVVAALYHARNESGLPVVAELIGGALGGHLGGRFPDILEPAFTPDHRGAAHSIFLLVAVGRLSLEVARQQCRTQARGCAQQKAAPFVEQSGRLRWGLAEILWYLAAGALSGFQAGYVSHLVLDARTPNGLPLAFR